MSKPLKNFINLVMYNQKSDWKMRLIQDWPTIINDLATHISLEKIEQETLTLGVEDTSWLQELYLLAPVILEHINSKLDHKHIKQLRFKQVQKKRSRQLIKKSMNQQSKPYIIHLSSREQKVLSSIKDPELKEVLKNFLLRCQREKQ